jgi:hypothetical protein
LPRPELKIVYEWNNKTVLIRGSERTPLPAVPETATSHADTNDGDSSPKDSEDAWEDASDSEEERQVAQKARTTRENARVMGRRIRYLGTQSSMSGMLGREVHGLEMQTSFRDQWDHSDSDDEDIEPREMKEIIRAM